MRSLDRSSKEEGIMKKHLATLLVLGALCGVTIVAQGAADYGDLAQNPTKIAAAMKDLNAEDAQTFAAALLKAANTLPVAADVKNGLLAQVAHQLVAGCKNNESKKDMLVTIFTQADPQSLPGISDVISVGLRVGQEKNENNITKAEFLEIAKYVITRVEKKTSADAATGTKADANALIRITMTIATFQRVEGTGLNEGKGLTPAEKSSLVGSLVSKDIQTVVGNVVAAAVLKNYKPMCLANGIDAKGNPTVSLTKANTTTVLKKPLGFVGTTPQVGGKEQTVVADDFPRQEGTHEVVDAPPPFLFSTPLSPATTYEGQKIK
jgi:hypothetical protein